jgi:hypothetical protein
VPIKTRDIVAAVRNKNYELKGKINEQSMGGLLKREFTDRKHAFVMKKKTKQWMVWVGLKQKHLVTSAEGMMY